MTARIRRDDSHRWVSRSMAPTPAGEKWVIRPAGETALAAERRRLGLEGAP